MRVVTWRVPGARGATRVPPGKTRFLGALLLVLAGAYGCGGDGGDPVSPAPPSLPPPRPSPVPQPPPPGAPRINTVYVGFATDRIEITEGQDATVDIEFEAYYASPPDPTYIDGRFALDLRAVVEVGSASGEDLLVSGVPVGDPRLLMGKGTTWMAMRALPDDLVEGSETLKLRLEPAPKPLFDGGNYPPAVEVTNGELEVVIHDASAATGCSEVRFTATMPRRLLPPGSRYRCHSWSPYETEVTVEANRGDALELERSISYGRIYDWRVETAGSRIRHHLVLQWDPATTSELRMQACPLTGGSPTLVCTMESCEIFPAGSELPLPGSPLACP